MWKGKKFSLSLSSALIHLSEYMITWYKVHHKFTQKDQIINWNRSLQQRMFTFISIRSNYLAKHPTPVSAPQVHWELKNITKLLVKFHVHVQYFIFCPSTYNKSLVPFLWPLVNSFTTSWNVLWVVESLVTI